MSAPVIEANGVVKALGTGAGRMLAIKGVDLALRAGELTLLMGPSGSGKTTLLSLLGCVLTPNEGRIQVAGTPTHRLSPEALAGLRRRHIGFVFQSFHLFPTLSAEENVRIVLDVRGERAVGAVQRASQALDAVGILSKARAFPRQLSGGEQQRVAIARALVGEPSAILADEPTAALDGETGHAVMALLARIAGDTSRAVLVVTHDPRTLPFANRIIRIEDGRIVGEERPAKAAPVARIDVEAAAHG
jgi:putative ABC transport system ATP-binding protein